MHSIPPNPKITQLPHLPNKYFKAPSMTMFKELKTICIMNTVINILNWEADFFLNGN